jgi:hypothetical protein
VNSEHGKTGATGTGASTIESAEALTKKEHDHEQ